MVPRARRKTSTLTPVVACQVHRRRALAIRGGVDDFILLFRVKPYAGVYAARLTYVRGARKSEINANSARAGVFTMMRPTTAGTFFQYV